MKENKKSVLTKDMVRTYLSLIALIVVEILFALLSHGRTLRWNNLKQIILQACTYTAQSWVMFPVILLICIACEMFIGSMNILLGINSVIVSFAVSFLGKGITGYLMNTRTKGLSLPSEFSFLYNRTLFYIITLVCIVVITAMFHYTKLGKRAMAIGSNASAAKAAGINVTKYKLLAYLVAGIMMGLTVLLTVLRAAVPEPPPAQVSM